MPLHRAQTDDECSKTPWPLIFLVAGLLAVCGLLQWSNVQRADEGIDEMTFDEPIDALSVTFADETDTATVEGFGTAWTEATDLHMENEQDPTLRESNLVLFGEPVTRVRFAGTQPVAVHPIRVTHDPISYQVAATTMTMTPRILSRSDWGADESLRIDGDKQTDSDTIGDNGEASGPQTDREKECEEAQRLYPEEFSFARVERENADGDKLRWPLQYSTSVKLLVVHHTAISITGDTRSGEEKMRALYAYHAKNRGWGDIGYHYLIDEDGHIFEGRAGGDRVVGGHAYCNNTGSIGIALMGNFEVEKPTQKEMQSLQWLLAELADRYDIDLDESTRFHGKSLDPVVGHRDLLRTDCPGEYVYRTLSQVRTHARTGNTDALVVFPTLERRSTVPATPVRTTAAQLTALGDTTIEARPGGDIVLSLLYRAGSKAQRKGMQIGRITRSRPSLAVLQEIEGRFGRVRGDIKLPSAVAAGASVVVRVKVELPLDRGTHELQIGDVTYTINSSGRRVRGEQLINTRSTSRSSSSISSARSSSSSRAVSSRPRTIRSSSSSRPATAGKPIRIRLTDTSLTANEATIVADEGVTLNGERVSGTIRLTRTQSTCTASVGERTVTNSIVRIDPGSTILMISSWKKEMNRYRGVIECRIVDGELALINELPLDTYLMGLAEEPDTEPYEKQRAFAIAARTYAAHYMDPANRKFPGKPYDGSDSPAVFQLYGGVLFEARNPRWVDAAESTASRVLTKNGQIIRPPYFSSDDGRTRAPAEAGWNNFPFAEIFTSKPDPWCDGQVMRGHGVGMSGCGAEGQANEGKSAEQILEYYYPGATLEVWGR